MNLAPTTASLKRPEKGFKMRYVSLLIALFAVLNNLYSMSTECARLFSVAQVEILLVVRELRLLYFF